MAMAALNVFVPLLTGPLGIFGPMLLLLLGLWLGRGNRSPWFVKAALLALLSVMLLIMFGYL